MFGWGYAKETCISLFQKEQEEKAVMQIMATMDGVPVEEYKCNVFTLPVKILQLLNDPALVQLFTYQGQTGDATSSGSASENTEE